MPDEASNESVTIVTIFKRYNEEAIAEVLKLYTPSTTTTLLDFENALSISWDTLLCMIGKLPKSHWHTMTQIHYLRTNASHLRSSMTCVEVADDYLVTIVQRVHAAAATVAHLAVPYCDSNREEVSFRLSCHA